MLAGGGVDAERKSYGQRRQRSDWVSANQHRTSMHEFEKRLTAVFWCISGVSWSSSLPGFADNAVDCWAVATNIAALAWLSENFLFCCSRRFFPFRRRAP